MRCNIGNSSGNQMPFILVQREKVEIQSNFFLTVVRGFLKGFVQYAKLALQYNFLLVLLII